MEHATIVMETPLGDVTIAGGYEIVTEVQARCNAHDALTSDVERQEAKIADLRADLARYAGHRLALAEHIAELKAQCDALVEACEDTLESIDLATKELGDSVAGGVFRGAFFGVRRRIVTALALVEKQPQ